MCVAAAAIPAASLAISAVSTVASIGMGIMSAQQQAAQAQAQMNMQARQQEQNMQMQRQSMMQQRQMQQQSMLQQQRQQRDSQILQQRQAQEQYNLSVIQANTQIQNQYQQQRAQVEAERANIQAKYAADRLAYQHGKEDADKQIKYNNEAANEVYQQEQTKIEAKKAAFAQQTALAKAIGSKGAILSAGRTGQSVGLLVNDAERQAGFAQAQADAQLASTMEQSQISMDQAFLQSLGANNQAESRVGMAPTDPYMPAFPGIPNFVDPYQQQEPAFGAA